MRIRTCLMMMIGIAAFAAAYLPVEAAEFTPQLEAELRDLSGDEMISVIVILESPVDIRQLDDRLHKEGATLARRHKEIIDALRYNADVTQPSFRAELEEARAQGQLTGYSSYWIENLIVVRATKEFVETLRGRGDIRHVTENFAPELIEPLPGSEDERQRNSLDGETTTPGQDAMGTTQVNRELGLSGQGVIVANMDTGVDGSHPALASRWRGNFAPAAECWLDVLGGNTSFPSDGNGHGTHVMGTMAGREINGVDTNTVGSAPDARWIACNAIDQGGSPGGDFDNDVLAALQWFADRDGNAGTTDDVPDVIQNSWGVYVAIVGYPQCYDFWNTAIMNCEAAGPVITWSAGNEAVAGLRSPAIYEINDYQVFAVGAVDATNFGAPYPIAEYSSQGPSPCLPNIGATKPDIAAPGTDIYSSLPCGGYGFLSGTSMAGPHVAGVVALMREACPDCDYITIKQAIMDHAVDYGVPGDDNQFGHGFIQAYDAVLDVSMVGRIVGEVKNTLNEPIAGARARVVGGLKKAISNAGGEYALPLVGGSYDLEYSAFGYVSQTINGVALSDNDTTYQDVVLVSAPAGVVSGTVTNCFGAPEEGATVTALGTLVPPATANAAGFYSLPLPQGNYDLEATGSGGGCLPLTVTGVNVGAATTQDFVLPGNDRYLCSPADAGGYIACENGDPNGPTFQWFEISPLEGGPGTLMVLNDDDADTAALPFTFRMYGQDYTQAYISTNGFVSFDFASTAYANTALPNPELGHAVVCYWEDWHPELAGDVSYYYHAAEHALIVEWHDMPHGAPDIDPRETFQVWLYDAAVDPAPSGDSRIRMQYLVASAASSTTIGVQDGVNANQYVHNGTLDPTSQGVGNGRVIMYGQMPPEFSLSSPNVSPTRGTSQTEFAFSVIYTSMDNVTPTSADVVIDGMSHAMGTADLDYTNGSLITYMTTLGCGLHEHHFAFAAGEVSLRQPEAGDFPIPIVGSEIICYDFETDQGWTVGAIGDLATTGVWDRGDPEGTYSVTYVQPEDDHTSEPGVSCYVTQAEAGTAAGDFDVDNGQTTLLSPILDFSMMEHVSLELWSWFSNDQGTNPLGLSQFRFSVSSDGGTNWVDLIASADDWEFWKQDNFVLDNFVALTDQMRLRAVAEDIASELVEAAVDDICLVGIPQGPPESPAALTIHYAADEITLNWEPSGCAATYHVYSAAASDGPFTELEGSTTETQFTLALPEDFLKFYVVTAEGGAAGAASRPGVPRPELGSK